MTGDVFVYGTLRPGGGAFEVFLAGRVGPTEPAVLPGYGLRGAGGPYPFAVPEEGAQVVGELVSLPPGSEQGLLAELDAYEGPQYRRVEATVQTPDGSQRVAWVYVAAPGVDPGPPVTGGDWLAGG